MAKEIPLTQGLVAVVDDDDYGRVGAFRWWAVRRKTGRCYAVRRGDKSGCHNMPMHREVLGYFGPLEIDHIDGDGLNNQRSNLRICTKSQNNANRDRLSCNKSGFKGVCFQKPHNKWAARITVNNSRIRLGLHDNPQDAARAYDAAATRYFGEFALTNEMLGLLLAHKPQGGE